MSALRKLSRSAALLAVAAALPLAAGAQTRGYTVNLSGANEAPPNASPGTGFATVVHDLGAHTMTIDVAFSGLLGNVTASHFAMNCLKPAVGDRFVAKGTTVQAGRRQVFAHAKLLAVNRDGKETLVATGETLMIPIGN